MAVNYQKLWDLLQERCMTRSELREAAGVTTNAMVKIGKNESVQAEVLVKICRVLNCTMNDIMDIEYHVEASEILPEIDFFDEINSSSEFSTLDINMLSDFPEPHSKESIEHTLIEYCRSAKLSYDACAELVEVLSSKGVSISLPQEIIPDINLIPFADIQREDCTNSEIAVITQQINNYLIWAMKKAGLSKQELEERVLSYTDNDRSYFVEEGYITLDITHNDGKYVGTALTTKSTRGVYPFNLIDSIFGDKGSRYCLTHRLSMLSEQVDNMLSTLSPREESWVRLIFQYGVSSTDFLELLNIPYNEAFLAVMQDNPVLRKALRKLRHPSRSRKLKDYWEIDPFKTCYLDWYSSWTEDIKEKVVISLENGRGLVDALSEFYNDNIVEQIIKESNRWKETPNISIDEMELSWRTYAAIDVSNIRSLEELWNKHGRNLSLKDLANSGLRSVAGIGIDQVSELLDKMEKYDLQPIDISSVSDIIEYSERLANGNGDIPSIACAGIHPDTLNLLLQLKYRNIDEVIADYSNGCLELKVKDQEPLKWADVCAVLDMFVDRKFPVTHYCNNEYWRAILAKNTPYTLEDIRQAYILDKPLKCNPTELQEHIEGLFPVQSLAFNIMHKTRTRAIRWRLFPLSVFFKEINQYRFLDFEGFDNWKIKRVFDATYDNLYDYRWIVIEKQINNGVKYCFFELGKSGLKEMNHLEEQEKMSLFQAIEFNAEILRHARDRDDYIISSTISENDITKPIVTEHARISDELLQLSIEELDLGCRAYNCLKRAGIENVRSIINLNKSEFKQIRNIGKKQIIEILLKLKALGIDLSDSLQELFDEL